MKSGLLLSILLFVFFSIRCQDLNVMTFNIRLNTPADSMNAWPFRKDKVNSQVIFHKVHVLGVQEALNDQVLDLQAGLPHFRFTGGGRDDGKAKGEYSAIFYDTARLQLLRSNTFWLSLTPEQPGSKSWDAAITRIVTWAEFRDRKTKQNFFVFNTHFDHIGQIARRESALLLKKEVHRIAGKIPVIVMGDFNARPAEEPIQVLLDKKDSLYLMDSKELSLAPHYGPMGTFNGFKSKERDDQPIDYIFVKDGWKVLQHATISQTWEGRFASDHFAVFGVFRLNKAPKPKSGKK
ncbi:MAG TPA: endonuclease/exonuclease/phosphatase family protein [Chitinophagaceae bacterium]|nr:endonuclease/exonuclease/phosphatase family protein [Chitinophagaceae bacterium]